MPKRVLRKSPGRRMKQLKLRAPKRDTRRVKHVSPAHDQLGGASVTYQLELVQCGKPKCRKWHGPYWYAYWTSGGRTRSLYIGKLLRPAADVATELVERRKLRATVAQKEQEQLP